jgi:hypothetical protein
LDVLNIGAAVRRSAPRPGSATHGYRRTESETTIQAATPPLSPGTLVPVSTFGPQATSLKTRIESASTYPVTCSKIVRRDVRRHDRGQRPTATEERTHMGHPLNRGTCGGTHRHVRHPLFRPQSRQKWVS